jgi:hypothetical protein
MNVLMHKRILPRSVEERRIKKIPAQFIFICLTFVLPAPGQNRAEVSVDLSKPVNVLTDTSLGVPAIMSDASSFALSGVPYLRAAGITAARYPGNHNAADLYHWSTKTTTPYRGADVGYFAPESAFPDFARFAEQLGQAVIVVNYGSNMDGTGGGEPAEAAAWVAYANGNPSDKHVIGKDSTGQNWYTTGYWASLRGQAPLATDDGLNFLRIQHPRPFGFRLWQVGGEVYDNGYYGGQYTGDPDLHGPVPARPRDLSKLKGNAKLSPAAYAENFRQFAQAMKAVDPSIEVGAAFTVPPSPDPNSHDWAPDWNREVLKGACADLDFVTFDWTLQPLLPPDWKTLDEATLLQDQGYNQTNLIDLLVQPMLQDYQRYCPPNHLPRLAFAPAAIAAWVTVEHPVVKALWIADFYASLVESGSANINWDEMYGDSMLSADRKTLGPAFYGLQMLHIVVHQPGDVLVDARSNSSIIAAHASLRRDGYVGLMLVNKDPHLHATVKVTFRNGSVGTAGRRIDYGSAQFAAHSGPSVSRFSVTGDEFSVTVPPYTITDILLPRQK